MKLQKNMVLHLPKMILCIGVWIQWQHWGFIEVKAVRYVYFHIWVEGCQYYSYSLTELTLLYYLWSYCMCLWVWSFITRPENLPLSQFRTISTRFKTEWFSVWKRMYKWLLASNEIVWRLKHFKLFLCKCFDFFQCFKICRYVSFSVKMEYFCFKIQCKL